MIYRILYFCVHHIEKDYFRGVQLDTLFSMFLNDFLRKIKFFCGDIIRWFLQSLKIFSRGHQNIEYGKLNKVKP